MLLIVVIILTSYLYDIGEPPRPEPVYKVDRLEDAINNLPPVVVKPLDPKELERRE